MKRQPVSPYMVPANHINALTHSIYTAIAMQDQQQQQQYYSLQQWVQDIQAQLDCLRNQMDANENSIIANFEEQMEGHKKSVSERVNVHEKQAEEWQKRMEGMMEEKMKRMCAPLQERIGVLEEEVREKDREVKMVKEGMAELEKELRMQKKVCEKTIVEREAEWQKKHAETTNLLTRLQQQQHLWEKEQEKQAVTAEKTGCGKKGRNRCGAGDKEAYGTVQEQNDNNFLLWASLTSMTNKIDKVLVDVAALQKRVGEFKETPAEWVVEIEKGVLRCGEEDIFRVLNSSNVSNGNNSSSNGKAGTQGKTKTVAQMITEQGGLLLMLQSVLKNVLKTQDVFKTLLGVDDGMVKMSSQGNMHMHRNVFHTIESVRQEMRQVVRECRWEIKAGQTAIESTHDIVMQHLLEHMAFSQLVQQGEGREEEERQKTVVAYDPNLKLDGFGFGQDKKRGRKETGRLSILNNDVGHDILYPVNAEVEENNMTAHLLRYQPEHLADESEDDGGEDEKGNNPVKMDSKLKVFFPVLIDDIENNNNH